MRTARALVGALLLAGSSVLGGSNGLATTPPMSWRSWNQFSWYIDADLIEGIADGLVDTSRTIIGRPAGTSLRDLGYATLGLDEGWAACAPPPGYPAGNWTFHRSNADGSISPVVNNSQFPDMRAMVASLSARGLAAGWYLNGCASYCWRMGDTCGDECNAGDVAALTQFGFRAVKFDGCSAQHNASLWSALLNATGVPVLIENCHDTSGPALPISAGGCPFYHTYRTSTDIRNAYGSWVANAQTVSPFTDGRSGPTCWSYPDMLMVGVTVEINGAYYRPATFAEQRTHLGMWAVLSAPITLSLDLRDAAAVDAAWPIITNVDALAVNQAWGGSPGGLFAHSAANVTLPHCTPDWDGDANCTLPATQAWYKPLPGGGAAVLVANHGPAPVDVRITLADVPGLACAPRCAVRDVWAQADAGVAVGAYAVPSLPSHDSVFVTLAAAP